MLILSSANILGTVEYCRTKIFISKTDDDIFTGLERSQQRVLLLCEVELHGQLEELNAMTVHVI